MNASQNTSLVSVCALEQERKVPPGGKINNNPFALSGHHMQIKDIFGTISPPPPPPIWPAEIFFEGG